jgi:hypothetical protein
VTPRSIALALAAAAALLAGCGPDCQAYCRKLRDCLFIAPNTDQAEADCVQGCNVSGGDEGSTIKCVLNHGCTDLRQGHCDITGAH